MGLKKDISQSTRAVLVGGGGVGGGGVRIDVEVEVVGNSLSSAVVGVVVVGVE